MAIHMCTALSFMAQFACVGLVPLDVSRNVHARVNILTALRMLNKSRHAWICQLSTASNSDRASELLAIISSLSYGNSYTQSPLILCGKFSSFSTLHLLHSDGTSLPALLKSTFTSVCFSFIANTTY